MMERRRIDNPRRSPAAAGFDAPARLIGGGGGGGGSQARTADLSIEFAHLALSEIDERTATQAAQAARRWLQPLIAAFEDSGLSVSTVVLLDDYFAHGDVDVAEKARLLEAVCDDAGLRLDHIAYESACAASVERMRATIVDVAEERHGRAGASRSRRSDLLSGWLANGDPGRPLVAPTRPAGDSIAPSSRGSRRRGLRARHAVHLDVELWRSGGSQPLWSCPLLAAWWQLIRLGTLLDEASGRSLAPPGTQSRAGASPFIARRTLTLLEPRFIEVEHAVRVILDHVRLPKAWRQVLADKQDGLNAHPLERIAYLFVPVEP